MPVAHPLEDVLGTDRDRSGFTLANVVRRHAAQRPDRPALICGEQRCSFGELHERSSRAANALAALGVGAGDRVAVLCKNSIAYYELLFAASKLDATLVGLNWRLAPPEIAAIVADAAPRALVLDVDHVSLAPVAKEPPAGMGVLFTGEAYERALAAADPADPQARSGPQSVVLQLYSSGTTGRPKGVMLTNENMSYSATVAANAYRIGPESTNTFASPMFHIGGVGYGLMAITQGGRTVIMQQADGASMVATIERERVSHAFLVPTMIQGLVEAQELAGRDLSSLELVLYGGAPMTETLLLRAIDRLGCAFLGVYGMTETAGTVICLAPEKHVPDGPDARLLRSIGQPLPWVQARVCDVQSGAELPAGEVGEIWLRTGQTMKGYFKQPQTTAAALVADGWLRTGDAAYRDEQGHFFLHDRIKDMVISGGENIYPAEIENVLAEHPAVAEVAVIGAPHERWGETVVAVVVARQDADADAEQLIAFTRTRLAKYKCPTAVEFVAELPRNASGKVLKHVLRASRGTAGR
jgi:acyl-CoA synthetase (AMP-forming)/AMP-acid ligase II